MSGLWKGIHIHSNCPETNLMGWTGLGAPWKGVLAHGRGCHWVGFKVLSPKPLCNSLVRYLNLHIHKANAQPREDFHLPLFTNSTGKTLSWASQDLWAHPPAAAADTWWFAGWGRGCPRMCLEWRIDCHRNHVWRRKRRVSVTVTGWEPCVGLGAPGTDLCCCCCCWG